MLSKLVRADAMTAVQAHVWRPAGTPPPPASPQKVFPGKAGAFPVHEAPAEQQAGKLRLAEEQLLALQARLIDTEQKAERRVKEGREAAYREGETAGRAQAEAEVRPVLETLARSIHDLSGLRPKLREQAESDVVRLALAIAKRIVHRELNTDPDAIIGLVKVALDKLRVQETTRVRVHPAQQAIVREMLSHLAGAAHVEVTGDAAAGLGGVIFETSRGEFDMSADVQLGEIEKGLTDRLRN